MLRATIVHLRDQIKIVLTGQLVSEWAECLPTIVAQYGSVEDTVQIDLDGITAADHAGEEALLALSRAHRGFLCTSAFARGLCERLGIPVEGDVR